MDPKLLRQTYPVFSYEHSDWQLKDSTLTFTWRFSISPDHTFKPTLDIFGVTPAMVERVSPQTLDWYAFNLGLVEMLSYWKVSASPQLNITAGSLTPTEVSWWQKLFTQGLGEYFYQNQLLFTAPDFVTWHTTGPSYQPHSQPANLTPNSLLVPVGGGKDSAVTLEIARQAVRAGNLQEVKVLVINPIQSALDLAELSQLPLIRVERHLDPHLLELNALGFLNGHTPFSAMAAWVSTLVAHLHELSWVAVSNERSSNEGNIFWLNQEINHQYSKTYTFEQDFQEYIHEHLEAPLYFSFLRPIYELQIGKIFANIIGSDNPVRSRFRSCNRGQKTNSWCGDCPKCLFAFLILRPFIAGSELTEIFGRDVLVNDHLYPTLLELVGRAETKPFECVGTHEESLCAAHLSLLAYQHEGLALPSLLTKLDREVLSQEQDLPQRSQVLLHSWNEHHALPDNLVLLLQRYL